MADLFPVDSTATAGQGSQTPSSIYMNPATASILIRRRPQQAGPIPRDPKLPVDHPEQSFTDCRTIEGWTDTIHRLAKAAWGENDPDSPGGWRFTHDFSELPEDPTQLKGVVIVYEILSMMPGSRGKDGIERKPLVREIIPRGVAAQEVASDGTVQMVQEPGSQGRTVVLGQRFDCVVRFMIYGDKWGRTITYRDKLFDLIQTYTGIFKQAGLAQLFFRMQGQDVLHDPPRVQEFPNQTLMYNVTVERITRATFASIEQVLIKAGILNPLTGEVGDQLIEQVEGVPDSPILPAVQ